MRPRPRVPQLNAIAFATYLDATLSGLGVLASIAIAFMTSAINATLPLLAQYLTQCVPRRACRGQRGESKP